MNHSSGGRAGLAAWLLVGMLAASAGVARAEVVVDAFIGTSRTRDAAVRIHQPGLGNDFRIRRLAFDDESFATPPYYGLRVAYVLAGRPSFGLALDFFHFKIVARTDESRRLTGTHGGAPIDATIPVNAVVQRFEVSHGVNYLMLNGLLRYPVLVEPQEFPRGRVQVYGGLGLGPVITHTATTIGGVRSSEGYEVAGVGVQGFVGLRALLTPRVGLFVEYKLTRSDLDLSLGTGRARLEELSHHVVGGITVSLPWF